MSKRSTPYLRVIPLLLAVTGAALGGCNSSQPGSTAASAEPENARSAPPAGPAMVAAADARAVDAGLAALKAGGTAIDAALAVQTVLGLVEPQSSGIGGGAFIVYYDKGLDQVRVYDGRETAPQAASGDMFLGEDGKPLGYIAKTGSGLATGAPGAIPALHMAHQNHGKLAWADGFEAAITLADDGFVVSPRLAALLERFGKYNLSENPNTKSYFFTEDGQSLPEGFLRDNPAYAQTLRALQTDPRALHEGEIAQEIVNAVSRAPRPGRLTLEDLKAYKPIQREALCSPYRAYRVCSAPPPSSGGVAVQAILGLLNNTDMAALGQSASGWHMFIEASQLAYADRDKYVADPAFVTVPTKAMVDPDYLAQRARLINPDETLGVYPAGDPAGFTRGDDATPDVPGTSHMSIADGFGNVVSLTTTVEGAFGSRRMAGGFLLNNQLTDFSSLARDDTGVLIANRVQPGKRPRSSMAPTIVFDDTGEFYIATGSPGGNSIIAYTAKSIIGMIDWGLSPQEAAALPNVISRNGTVRIEENVMDAELLSALESKGHDITRSQGEISGIHIIRRNPDGTLTGGADPRREGIAKGIGAP